ncbi:hypothetical protein JCM10213_008536 [Rhodosporidiobolus nylandii]
MTSLAKLAHPPPSELELIERALANILDHQALDLVGPVDAAMHQGSWALFKRVMYNRVRRLVYTQLLSLPEGEVVRYPPILPAAETDVWAAEYYLLLVLQHFQEEQPEGWDDADLVYQALDGLGDESLRKDLVAVGASTLSWAQFYHTLLNVVWTRERNPSSPFPPSLNPKKLPRSTLINLSAREAQRWPPVGLPHATTLAVHAAFFTSPFGTPPPLPARNTGWPVLLEAHPRTLRCHLHQCWEQNRRLPTPLNDTILLRRAGEGVRDPHLLSALRTCDWSTSYARNYLETARELHSAVLRLAKRGQLVFHGDDQPFPPEWTSNDADSLGKYFQMVAAFFEDAYPGEYVDGDLTWQALDGLNHPDLAQCAREEGLVEQGWNTFCRTLVTWVRYPRERPRALKGLTPPPSRADYYPVADAPAFRVEQSGAAFPFPISTTVNIGWNGERVELDKEAERDALEGTIRSLEGTPHADRLRDIEKVYVAELNGAASWNMAAGLAEQRSWTTEWRKQRSDHQKEKKAREDSTPSVHVAAGFVHEHKPPVPAAADTFECNTKYKPKGVKVEPLDQQLPPGFDNAMIRPPYSRDPYQTPLTAHPPDFEYGGRLTEERVAMMEFGPEGWLWPEEKKLLLQVLRLREKALAFDESEMGRRKESYGPPTKLPVVPHTPWQETSFPVPAAIRKKVIALFRRQLAAGIFEPSQSSYAGRWFCIEKKNGDVRLVMSSEKINGISIRDCNVPPPVREYISDLVGYHSYFLIDLFSGYLQEPLDVASRDMTTIRTPIGLLRLTRLPIGGTNSVAQYQRRISFILQDELPEHCLAFVDDIGGKGSKTDYGGETLKENPGIRRWCFEHAVKLERILFRLEEAGLTASGAKLVVATPRLTILGTIVSKEGREADPKKVDKISNWPAPRLVADVRAFYGLYNFLRDYAPGTKEAEALIRAKLKNKGEHSKTEIEWTDEDQAAMDTMKAALAKGIRLTPINYSPGAGRVIVAVDSSYIAAGVAIWQIDSDGKRQPCKFDSIPFNEVESRYSQPKLELAGVFKALKKYKNDLYGIQFDLEVDAASLAQMLRNPELPNAAMTRWVSYLKLFDFTLRHISGREHVVPDALSRRTPLEGEEPEDFDVEDDEITALHTSLATYDMPPFVSQRRAFP